MNCSELRPLESAPTLSRPERDTTRSGADVLHRRGAQTQCHQWARSHRSLEGSRRLCRSVLEGGYRRSLPQPADSRRRTSDAPSRSEASFGSSRVGIDALASRYRGNHVRRSVAEPERGHVDEGAVVGLQRHAQVELEDAVAAEKRPVAASGEHLSAQPRALEGPVPDRGGQASTVRYGAELLYGADCDAQSSTTGNPCVSLRARRQRGSVRRPLRGVRARRRVPRHWPRAPSAPGGSGTSRSWR